MKKKIDTLAVALMLFPIELLGGLEEALRDLFQKMPESEHGPEIDEDAFVVAGVKLYDNHVKPLIEDMLGGKLPVVTEDDLPKPTTTPPPTTTPGPEEEFPGYKIFAESRCDAPDMVYGPGGNNQKPQKRCLFRDYSNCSQMPSSFRVVWIDAAGRQESLDVPSNCSIAMGQESAGYRKWRPIDDHYPHPVAYAPRGFSAVRCVILVRN